MLLLRFSLCSNAATNISMRQMPWVLAKDEAKKDRLATVLYHLIEGIRMGAVLLESFMPETSEKILSQIQAENCDLENLAFGQYVSGTKVVEKPEILFAETGSFRSDGPG